MRILRYRAWSGSGAVAAALIALVVTAAPASAGGSWFDTTEQQYEPGDRVTIVGDTTGGQLGWIEDGPFYGYLRVTKPDLSLAERWPVIAPTDLPLGRLHLERMGTVPYALRASLTFDLPTVLAPGAYDFVYCNDPCTTGLGDLVGGIVYVGVPPPGAEPTPAPPPSTIATTTTSVAPAVTTSESSTTGPSQNYVAAATQGPTRTSGDNTPWVLAAVALIAVSAAAGLALTRHKTTSPAAHPVGE